MGKSRKRSRPLSKPAESSAPRLPAGRADPNPPQDLGFMFNRHIEDPDGYVWGITWMDPAALANAPESA
jgi:hypothetical protein